VGTKVQVADHAVLTRIRESWKLHNPLLEEQLSFAGRTTRVSKVSFFHGGAVLDTLEGMPGVWHEECLRPVITNS